MPGQATDTCISLVGGLQPVILSRWAIADGADPAADLSRKYKNSTIRASKLLISQFLSDPPILEGLPNRTTNERLQPILTS